MIWLNLAFFVVSFLITALLAPKPELEDARPQSLEDVQFPRASEDAPIPLCIGTVVVRAPNTIWYGDFEARPITKKVKTGLFSSKKVTVGFEYFLGYDLALCLGPVDLKRVIIDSVDVFGGESEGSFEDISFLLGDVAVRNAGDTTESPKVIPTRQPEEDPLTGFTEDDIDEGEITFGAQKSAVLTLTPLAGGGPASGTITMTLVPRNANGDDLSGLVQTPLITSTSGEGSLSVSGSLVLPPGCRSVGVNVQLVSFVPVATEVEIVDGNSVVFGRTTSDGQAFDIFEPELYGGKESGGGHVGNATFYRGTFQQGIDSYVQSFFPDQIIPAYRGTSHVVFEKNNIGEQPALRKAAFEVCRFPSALETLGLSDNKVNEFDANPMEAIFLILTDTWSGLGGDASDINTANFIANGETLLSEGNGVSINLTSQSDGQAVLQEILRQIDGFLFQDPQSGLIELTLIRDDYSFADLPSYDETDVLEVQKIVSTTFEEVISEVKVSFSSRDKEGSRVALARDNATANTIGRPRASRVSFPFCYDPDLAVELATRELSQLSVPLKRLTLELNRNAFNLRPGDVFRFSWPEYGFVDLVLRVQKHDAGELLKGRIVIECIQDVFALSTVVAAAPQNSLFQDPIPSPSDILDDTIYTVGNRSNNPFTGSGLNPSENPSFNAQQVVEAPAFFTKDLADGQLADDRTIILPWAVRPSTLSTNYWFAFSLDEGANPSDFDNDPEDIVYSPTGLITFQAYDKLSGYDTGQDLVDGIYISNVENADFEAATLEENRSAEGGIIYCNGEWMAYQGVATVSVDDGSGLRSVTQLTNIQRGLFGSEVRGHAIGDRVWTFDTSMKPDGIQEATPILLNRSITGADTVYYRLRDRAGATLQDANGLVQMSFGPVDAEHRKAVRPRNVQLAGVRDLTTPTPNDVVVTWSPSNRLEVGQVTYEVDEAQTPDQVEEYIVRVEVDGVIDNSLTQTVSTTTATVPIQNAVNFDSANEILILVQSQFNSSADLRSEPAFAVVNLDNNRILLSGDASVDASDALKLSGDAQVGGDDVLEQSGTQ